MNQHIHREAITHSLLDHPNIISFLGLYTESTDGPPLVVLPFLERGSLSEVMHCAGKAPTGVEFVWIVRLACLRLQLSVNSNVPEDHRNWPWSGVPSLKKTPNFPR